MVYAFNPLNRGGVIQAKGAFHDISNGRHRFNPLNKGGVIQACCGKCSHGRDTIRFNPLNPFGLHSGTRRGGGIQAPENHKSMKGARHGFNPLNACPDRGIGWRHSSTYADCELPGGLAFQSSQ